MGTMNKKKDLDFPVWTKCINAICFRADMFNAEQMDIVNRLMDSYFKNGAETEARKWWIKKFWL